MKFLQRYQDCFMVLYNTNMYNYNLTVASCAIVCYTLEQNLSEAWPEKG